MEARCLGPKLAALLLGGALAAQIPTGHHLVLTGTPLGGSALLDVDPSTGAVSPLRRFALDTLPPLACTWDPVARHAVVAVQAPMLSAVFRVDPASSFERLLALLPDPVIALELTERGDLYAVTGGPNGAVWEIERNGSTPVLRMAAPFATAIGAPKLSPIIWVAQAPPGAPPTIEFIDPRLGAVLVAPIPIPALAGRTITGVYDLPTGAIRELLTDDAGGVHLLEFTTTLRTLPVTPPLPAGAAVDLQFEMGATYDAVVLGDGRHPYVTRVPVFGGTPTATTLAGPLPGDPVDFDLVDSHAGWGFGSDCGGGFGAKSLLLQPGPTGMFEVRRAPANAPALAVFGFSEQAFAGILLPIALPGGCPLLVSPDVVVPTFADAGGVARLVFPVPPLPRGFALYAQWLLATPGGLGTTVGLSAQIEP